MYGRRRIEDRGQLAAGSSDVLRARHDGSTRVLIQNLQQKASGFISQSGVGVKSFAQRISCVVPEIAQEMTRLRTTMRAPSVS